MIDTNAIRKRIIEYALEGKLTNQQSSNLSAEALYCDIVNERANLEGKKLVTTVQLVSENIQPIHFEIPSTWKWINLYELTVKDIRRGKAPKYTEKSSIQVFAQKCNLKTGGINMKLAKFLDEEKAGKYEPQDYLMDGDIVINSTGTGTLGRVGIFKNEDKIANMPVVPDSHITFVRLTEKVNKQFVYLAIKNSQAYLEDKGVGSTNQRELRQETVMGLQIPLPPVQEQKQIVNKVGMIFSLLDKIDIFQANYLADCEILQSKLIDAAIHGKLTQQLPEDGTAEDLYQHIQAEKKKLIAEGKIKKEKPLPEITEDEKPFEIPESWKWVRVGQVGSWESGATPLRSHPEYYGGDIPWLKTGDLNDGFITEIPETITEEGYNNSSVRLNPVDSVLMAMYGATIGKLGILAIPATTNQACCACICYDGVLNKYLFYFLLAWRKEFISMGAGGAQPNISKEKIVNTCIPLPPLTEQKRIVARLEELRKAIQ